MAVHVSAVHPETTPRASRARTEKQYVYPDDAEYVAAVAAVAESQVANPPKLPFGRQLRLTARGVIQLSAVVDLRTERDIRRAFDRLRRGTLEPTEAHEDR